MQEVRAPFESLVHALLLRKRALIGFALLTFSLRSRSIEVLHCLQVIVVPAIVEIAIPPLLRLQNEYLGTTRILAVRVVASGGETPINAAFATRFANRLVPSWEVRAFLKTLKDCGIFKLDVRAQRSCRIHYQRPSYSIVRDVSMAVFAA